MEIQGLKSTVAGMIGLLGTSAAGGADGAQFRETLAKAQQTAREFDDKIRKESRDAAAGLVAHALILPMLKQIRQSTFNKDGPFSPGNGEKAFGTEFDMQIADRIAQSPKMPVTDSIAQLVYPRHRQLKVQKSGVDVLG